MPYRFINGIRHITTLEGEVRSGSFNRSLGWVTFVATNPCEIAFCPTDGKSVRTQLVSLDDAVGAVTLSRDIALCHAGDSVWSLLDIAHKPRVDKALENVRLLTAKPAGGSAVALTWDGRAAEIAAGKSDVTTRSFALRGELRGIDVGDTETAVVMDGGDGEFRIHPGSTPEQGALAKAPLPAGSAPLNCVRAGRFLSAVYRRNEATVVLVKRAGNRLEPRSIRFGFPVCDLAVAETSVVAAAPDGRIALFDAQAIDAATPSLIEATASVPLGCQGEIRALVVAGDRLYAGTSSGEVFESYLVRKKI